MATDRFEGNAPGLSTPATKVFAVTPHNTNDLTEVTRALYVGGAGNVEVVTKENDTVTFTAVPAGTILPVRCARVRAAGTTATTILGLV